MPSPTLLSGERYGKTFGLPGERYGKTFGLPENTANCRTLRIDEAHLQHDLVRPVALVLAHARRGLRAHGFTHQHLHHLPIQVRAAHQIL